MVNKTITNITFITLSLFPVVGSSSFLKIQYEKKMLIPGYVREGTHLISKKSSKDLYLISSIIASYFGYCCRFGESFSCKLEEGRTKHDFFLKKFLSDTIISYKKGANKIKQWRVENQKIEMISKLKLGANDSIQDIYFANPNYLVILLASDQIRFFKFPSQATKLKDKNPGSWVDSIKVNDDDNDSGDDDNSDDDNNSDDDDNSDDYHCYDDEYTIMVPWQNQVLIMKIKTSKVIITPWKLLDTGPVPLGDIPLDNLSNYNDCYRINHYYSTDENTKLICYNFLYIHRFSRVPFYSVKGKVVPHNSTLIKKENDYKLFCHRRSIVHEDLRKGCCKAAPSSSGIDKFSQIFLDNFLLYKLANVSKICAYDAYSNIIHHDLVKLGPGFMLEKALPITSNTFLLITEYLQYDYLPSDFKDQKTYELTKFPRQVFIMRWSSKSNPKQMKLECLASTGLNVDYAYANFLLSSQGLLVGIKNEKITFLPILGSVQSKCVSSYSQASEFLAKIVSFFKILTE